MSCILLTQSEPGATHTAHVLETQGRRCLVDPLLKITPKPLPPLHVMPQAWILTSQHAVPALASLASHETLIITVGPITQQAVQRHGFTNVVEAGGTVEAIKSWIRAHVHPQHGLIVYLSGTYVADELDNLTPFDIHRIIAYDAVLSPPQEQTLQALKSGLITEVWFYSKRVATYFAELIQTHNIAVEKMTAHCWRDSIQQVCQKMPWQRIVVD